MKIKAAVMRRGGEPLVVETLELAAPGRGEVLVEIRAAGICHSDLTFLDGGAPRLPIVLGHEAAGVVVACGEGVEHLVPGDHVLPMAMGQCGHCAACRSGRSNLCEVCHAAMVGQGALDGSTRLTGADGPVYQMGGVGAFASHAVVAAIKVAKVRADAPFAAAALFSCAVSTGVGAAVFDGAIQTGDSVAVFGLGGIGLNVVQGARLAGASRIIGVDPNPAREALARGFGLTDFVNPRDGDPAAAILALVPGGVDRAFEAVGVSAVVAQAVAATRAGWGRTVMLGVPTGETVAIGHFDLLAGRTIVGSMQGGCRVLHDIPRMVDWYVDGTLAVDPLITHRLPLSRVNEGIDLLRKGEAIRVVLDPGAE